MSICVNCFVLIFFRVDLFNLYESLLWFIEMWLSVLKHHVCIRIPHNNDDVSLHLTPSAAQRLSNCTI